MAVYFNINYEFDRGVVHQEIEKRVPLEGSDYICVADGVILDIANRNPEYLDVINGGMFAICDSSYVPLYLKWLYGMHVQQYCGSEIFRDIICLKKYRMIFLGAQQAVLDGLKHTLISLNSDVENMSFVELPFRKVDEFDYPAIAQMVEDDHADIVWVALGAPKQEYFMNKLKPYLRHGVMLGVGAAFKFYSGTEISRAPKWMVDHHMEFIHRIYKEPKKQIRRCFGIVTTLPKILFQEWRRK